MSRRRPFHRPSLNVATFLAALFLLCAALVLCMVDCAGEDIDEKPLVEQERQEIADFATALRHDSLHHEEERTASTDEAAQLFPFDPNQADSLTLARLGLRDWQISNLLKYRRAGGRWKSADDFHRLYGLSDEDYQRLRPYIRIASAEKPTVPDNRIEQPEQRTYSRQEKYPEGTVIDLNTADTTQLKCIPGIGSYLAAKICRHRERLGGFLSVGQIKEVEGLPEDIEKWFSVADNAQAKCINVNTATFRELVRHPYLNYEQVKSIFNYRQTYGMLKSWRDLSLDENFTAEDFKRLAPYFVFE